MGREEREQKLDEFLDRALSQYSAVEPQWGMEQRIVAKVRAADESRYRRVRFWAPLFAAAALTVVVAVMLMPRAKRMIDAPEHDTIASTPMTPSITAPSAIEPSRAAKLEARNSGRWIRAAVRPQKSIGYVPRESVFLSPTPLTADERALMALLKKAPREAETVSIAAKEQTQVPQKLTIQAINIEPLEAGGFGGGR